MAGIECTGEGIVYRNPVPHVHSIQAYFPSLVQASDGSIVASMVLGAAFESPDLHSYVTRSADLGQTWEPPQRLLAATRDRLTSDACRLTAMPGGELVAFIVRHDRTEHPDEGLANPANLGFVPTELLLSRSADRGRTWSPPAAIAPPLVGPSFELCCPIVPLLDGRWVLPTSTWRGWDGQCPNGMKMVALVSRDRGRTWPIWRDVMADPAGKVIYWESKIVELPDDRLLATAWAYDEAAAADLPNQYAISEDGGATWTPPRSTGILGQTLTPLVLPQGGILCVYRRMDEPGLWVSRCRLKAGEWVTEETAPLWGTRQGGLTATSANMTHNFNVLRFGAPTLMARADGVVMGAFWCYEDWVSNIRWFTLRVS